MECSSKYRSLKEETMKLENEDNKEYFDSQPTNLQQNPLSFLKEEKD